MAHVSETRDPEFWIWVASSPEAARALHGFPPERIMDVVLSPQTVPLASTHGGFLFLRQDSFSRVLELHTMFRPEGWGKEVHSAAKEAFEIVFADAEMIITHEDLADWRSRPPRSFGFEPSGPPFLHSFGEFRLWALTVDRWRASPARKRWRH